jgi:Fe-S cluster assembly iron-binding protein IscA
MVEISDPASREINKVLQMEQHKGKGLFINFMGFGCSGPVLGLALDEPDDSYSIYESNGIQVHIHADLAEQMKPLGGVPGPAAKAIAADNRRNKRPSN